MHYVQSLISIVAIVGYASIAYGQPWQTYDTSNGEWRSYAGDIRGTKYSPLDRQRGQSLDPGWWRMVGTA